MQPAWRARCAVKPRDSLTASASGYHGRMAQNTRDEQQTKYLTDAHSMEKQALGQLRLLRERAGGRC
jgi:hypothetical protein